MRIQTNLAAYSTQAKLSINSNKKSKSIEKLSSGQRLNRSADDAAGISISEKMRAQIRGMNRASANIQDGVSLVGVADGVLQEVTNMMHRIRELSVQASSDTNAQIDRNAIQAEVTDLISEINKQLGEANFNGIPLFDGSNVGTYEYAYGLTDDPSITPTDPAYIIANSAFDASLTDPLVITSGTHASVTYTKDNTFLGELNNAPSFPRQGIFVIRVQLPGSPPEKRDAVLDFATKNTTGAFDLDDFRDFYIGTNTAPPGDPPVYAGGEFSDWINEGKVVIDIDNDGGITVSTAGAQGGSQAQVTIGATSDYPVDTVFANSAILGAYANSSAADYGYITTITPVSSASALSSLSQESLWDSLPHPIELEYSIKSNDSSVPAPYHTMKFSTAGFTSLASFNAYFQANFNNNYSFPGTFSLVPHVDRLGNVYANFSFSETNQLNASGAYAHSPYYVSSKNPPLYYDPLDPNPSVTSDYDAVLSEKSGYLDITLSGIPGRSVPAVVRLDFSTNTAYLSIDNGNSYSASKTFQNITEMASVIEEFLNNSAFTPVPPPVITSSDYSSSTPVAKVSINGGKLKILSSERSISINVYEHQSDRPMFNDPTYYTRGTEQPHILSIDGTPGANVTITSGEYTDIDDFISKNESAFLPYYILKKNDAGTSLIIESTIGGTGIDVRDIKFSSPNPTSPANLLELLGFKNVIPDALPMFQDGFSHPSIDVPPSGLWIQGGANLDEGLFIYIPRLDAYDLGLMIRVEDFLAPNGSHRADGGVNGDNSIAGTGGVNMGTASYTTEANIEPIPMGHGLDVTTHEKASAAISITDNAINIMNKERAQLGATQNRLGFMNANLNINAENLTAAESRIRDVDMAKEVTNLVRNDILSQGSTAMLSISNNFPQAVLQLLG